MTLESPAPPMRWTSIVPVWAATAIAAVLVGVFASAHEYLGWLGVVMAGSILVTMAVQLGTQDKRGFVMRMGASIVGSFVLLALATGVLALLHL
ncbi:hypothetical protein HII28_07320 [Planctomonas sp. JC2975]|uniref:hypothetical protein n=1 Tax=Planctomonas sp. JC2975 TaxID=2729626 RepID=UPI0014765D19|nr:hypothetical protein [Planctomonas sp. JC2975]NNC11684.1 hypothetical protein [Planctomonas sp. JC2975]